MFYSIKGEVSFIDQRFIVVETYGVGYEILVSNPKNYQLGEKVSLFLHHEIKQDDEYLAGFKDKKEVYAFRQLLNVNGIGPKSALNILSNISYDQLLIAISNNDLDFIKNIPGIGEKAANQILLDLKGYIAKENKGNIEQFNEVKQALKSLKFPARQIDKILLEIYMPGASTQEVFKEALRRLNYAELGK